jgi:hypothetical protein
MDKYFFDVVGDFAANDLMGLEFASDDEACEHARYIVSRLASEKPELVVSGNYVLVRDGTNEIFRVPVASHIRPALPWLQL